MSTEKWLVVVGEETLELSLDDLRALILEGRVKPTDRVKKEGLNWIEARHPPALRAPLPTSTPPRAKSRRRRHHPIPRRLLRTTAALTTVSRSTWSPILPRRW